MPGSRRNLKAVLEYDGTDFHGFQRQRGLRTVQGVLEERWSRLLGEPIAVVGAGRTDAGVHAVGQVVSFFTSRPVPTERLREVLNAALPRDVKVQTCEEVEPEFHARRSAVSRRYCYRIVEREALSPLLGRYALVAPGRLCEARMAEAAAALVGRHDFRAFGRGEVKTTVRTLDCVRQGDWIGIWVEADSFLYQMVRRMVAALVAAGRGELEPEAVAEALRAGKPPREARTPAPACGLCLQQVSYGVGPERPRSVLDQVEPIWPKLG